MPTSEADASETSASNEIASPVAIERVTMTKLLRTIETLELELEYLRLQNIFEKSGKTT